MIAPVKGTHDIEGSEALLFEEIINIFSSLAKMYGYSPIQIPVLEHTELFSRGTGEGSDIVRKEMYTFLDKGDRSLTLRPELTAGVARSILTNKLYVNDLPLKVYYHGPAFRYERPQAGRYREFNTFGIEAIGVDDLYLDVETILLAYTMVGYLNFTNLVLKVNTLGDKEGRAAYKEALKAYFSKHIDSMCEDCKQRLVLNPLRILDCKVPSDIEIAKGAPRLEDYISKESKERFDATVDLLRAFGLNVEVDQNLVRGLDYYSGLVYEIHALDESGAKLGALLGGGHYDNLLADLGGPSLAGVGFGIGLERLVSLYQTQNEALKEELDVYFAPLGEKTLTPALALATDVRNAGFSADIAHGGKLGAMFKKAERRNAKVIAILGEDELAKGMIKLKRQEDRLEKEVKIEDLIGEIENLLAGELSSEEECGCGCGGHHDGEHHCCHEGEEHHHHEGEHHCCHHKDEE